MDLAVTFHDVKPIAQDDGPEPVCAIDYPPKFIEAMGYLRAVLRSDEHSERTLALTATCLQLNPANYTTWHFRRQILATLSLSTKPSVNDDTDVSNGGTTDKAYYDPERVKDELEFTESLVMGNNPKNYQIWHHRRSLLDYIIHNGGNNQDDALTWARKELEYTSSVFDVDSKNYHAWSHRQWIAKTINNIQIWESELSCTHNLIQKDIRNNSAWNHRWFTIHQSNLNFQTLDYDDAMVEISYGLDIGKIDPFNESPWRYIIGIILEQCRSTTTTTITTKKEMVRETIDKVQIIEQELYQNHGFELGSCISLVSAKIDLLELVREKDSYGQALSLVRDLGNTHDVIRKKYWFMREKELQVKLDACSK